MEPTIEQPLRTGSIPSSMDSHCNSGSHLDDARSQSNEPVLLSDSSVSLAPPSLPGLAIEGVPHGTEATELSLRVGTERHTIGDMHEAPTVRTQCLGSICTDSNREEDHTSVTEVGERLETTNVACGTLFLLAGMNNCILQDDDTSGAADDNPPSSSLPPSSSPAQVFSSSPLASSQSSFMPSDKVTAIGETKEYIPLDVLSETRIPLVAPEPVEPPVVSSVRKRPAESSDLTSLSEISTEQMSPHLKRMKVDVDDVPPTPKRSTLASQQRQYRKLITPFRSPILTTTVEPSRKIECSSAKSESAGGPMSATINSTSKQDLSSPPSQRQLVHSKKGTGTRTERAAAQFKSPIIQSGVPSSGVSGRPSIRLTPTVQMLEHRLQVLRRAVKVKEEKDEEVLQHLVTRWTEAGREAAYELWDLVKDTGDLQGKSSALGSCWGRGTTLSGDKNWGWDKPEDDVNNRVDWHSTEDGNAITCEEDETRNTLGTMLRQLRIDPATLGWDEQMETFID